MLAAVVCAGFYARVPPEAFSEGALGPAQPAGQALPATMGVAGGTALQVEEPLMAPPAVEPAVGIDPALAPAPEVQPVPAYEQGMTVPAQAPAHETDEAAVAPADPAASGADAQQTGTPPTPAAPSETPSEDQGVIDTVEDVLPGGG